MQTDRDVTRERALESALERDARERETIEVALTRIDSSATPEEIAASACTEIVGFADVDTAFVLILEPDQGWVLANVGTGADERPARPAHPARHAWNTSASAPAAGRGSRRGGSGPTEYDVMDAVESTSSDTAAPTRRSPDPARRSA